MSHQSRFDARYWMLGAGALRRPRGMVWGGRRVLDGEHEYVYLWWIHVDIWQNQYNIVKLKNKIKKKIYQVVWYSHLFQNFPQFIVIHTVKGFCIVNKAEIDVFLELSCFFDDPLELTRFFSLKIFCKHRSIKRLDFQAM